MRLGAGKSKNFVDKTGEYFEMLRKAMDSYILRKDLHPEEHVFIEQNVGSQAHQRNLRDFLMYLEEADQSRKGRPLVRK